jgi:tRNA 2-selenouridine synthase SelU
MNGYYVKMLLIYIKKASAFIEYLPWNILQVVNRIFLHTYDIIEDRSRCYDCGRNVHDFHVPDKIWKKIVNQDIVLCYDCFCNRSDKLGIKYRITEEQ